MSVKVRAELGTLPLRIARLPLDARGYPVPWFVEWIGGKPEFRAMDGQKFARAIRERRCWVCGDVLGRHLAFVLGPMCAVNRTNPEPPSHYECAAWSARFCPHMVRREDAFTESCDKNEGGLMRNPGCCGVWVTSGYTVFKTSAGATGYLIRIGPPERVEWYAEGRPATREEVLRSIDSGLPLLEAQCDNERTELDRRDARAALARARQAVEQWLPPAEVPA